MSEPLKIYQFKNSYIVRTPAESWNGYKINGMEIPGQEPVIFSEEIRSVTLNGNDVGWVICPFEELKDLYLPPYVEPLRLVSNQWSNLELFSYLPQVKEMTKEYGLKEYNYTLDNVGEEPLTWYGTFNSANIVEPRRFSGTYCGSNASVQLKSVQAGTLEECKAVHQANLDRLKAWFGYNTAFVNKNKMSTDRICDLMEQLRSLKSYLSTVKVMKKSVNDLDVCFNKIKYLEDILVKISDEHKYAGDDFV